MDKSVHLELSIIKLSKTLMYELWYDHIQPKYGKKAKLCYMDADIKKYDIYKDTAEDVKTRFDTSNYQLDSRKS